MKISILLDTLASKIVEKNREQIERVHKVRGKGTHDEHNLKYAFNGSALDLINGMSPAILGEIAATGKRCNYLSSVKCGNGVSMGECNDTHALSLSVDGKQLLLTLAQLSLSARAYELCNLEPV